MGGGGGGEGASTKEDELSGWMDGLTTCRYLNPSAMPKSKGTCGVESRYCALGYCVVDQEKPT